MSSNHYGHVPPSAANLHPVTTNRQKTDFVPPPKATNSWSFNQSNEFENREKYMETELTDGLYTSCDNITNLNEPPDDEPYPPPGLRRLVTGQTVSFDDSPNSPPFDRVVPGEGSAFSSYITQSQPSQINDAVVGERFVSGGTSKEYNPIPQHMFAPVSGGTSKEYNLTSQHTFGPIPATKQESAQFSSNNNFYASEAHNAHNVSSEDFFDSYLRIKNTSDERSSHQSQVKNKSFSSFNTHSSQPQHQPYPIIPKVPSNPSANSAFQNYQLRSLPTKQENVVQYENVFHQRTFDDFPKSKSDPNESQSVDTIAEGGLKEHYSNSMRNSEKRLQNDGVVDKIPSSRMVVEGATNESQPKMVSTSTPVQSPSYDYWYENNAVSNSYEFSLMTDVKNVYINRVQDDSVQNAQPPLPPMTHSATLGICVASTSSNISGVNGISGYQQYENHTNVESVHKRKEELDSTIHRNVRLDEIEAKDTIPEPQIQELESNEESFHNKSDVYGENNDYANVQNNKMRKDKDMIKYSKNPIIENPELPSGRLNREPVPGAQSAPNDSQKSFSKLSAEASFGYGLQGAKRLNDNDDDDDDDERHEGEMYSDSDEKRYTNQRMAPGYNNYNPIPVTRKHHSKLRSDPRYGRRIHANMKPPLETRMVVGETSSDVSLKVASNRGCDDEYECDDHDVDRDRNRSYEEEKTRRIGRDLNRNEKDRKKSGKGRHRNESDEEYTESLGHGYDVSPDRGSRFYREKHRRDSPTRYKKSSQRMDCESSVTQDDSFNEDEDDDRETYRRYESRRHPRSRPYRPYYDPVERDWGYHDRTYWDHYPDDAYTKSSRPSSRSGSREPMEFVHSSRGVKLPSYNLVEKSNPNTTTGEIQYWAKMRHADPTGYMRWFRRTYPQEYSEWYYWRYMKHKTYQDDRRGSGHSGQSSVNNDSMSVNEKLAGMKDLSISSGDPENNNVAYQHRKSPFKFKMPHVKALFNSLGQLIVVNESCPKEGQSANIDVYEISAPDDDPDVVEFMNFTGPFIVGETHVNTVSEFVRYHAACASTSSEKLLYLLIDLIIKLRGVTDGIAISELLMTTYRDSQKLNAFTLKNEPSQSFSKSGVGTVSLSEHETIEKYTNLLLQGNKNAALDWAINHKLWGHAFLLASKMGDKHYSNVLTKFDASISTNNPLKTLYQLYSNQIPQAATACGDEKWGDWRPHLAIILSNPTPDNKVDKAAIITLGDSLYSKDIFASHFCYLAAEANFEVLSKPSAKLSLLSLRNGIDHFGVNTSNHAILLTQTYEFAKRLQRKEFTISALLPYKYLLAVRLIDFGKSDIALQYLESVAIGLQSSCGTDDINKDLAHNVIELAESIKYSDSKPFVANRSVDPPWLKSLRELVTASDTQFKSSNDHYSSGDVPLMDPQTLQSNNQTQLPPSLPVQQLQEHQPQEQQREQTPTGIQPPLMFTSTQQHPQPRIIAPNQGQSVSFSSVQQNQQQPWEMNSYVANHQNLFSGYGQPINAQTLPLNNEASFGVDETNLDQSQKGGDQQNAFYSPWDQPQQSAQISMHSTSNSFYDDGPPKPIAKMRSHSVAVTATTISTTSTVSKMNRASLRKQVQANVANKQHYSIVKHYLNRRRTNESAGRGNHLGQLMKNASFYYDTLCNSRIVFNGTFPIDRPFGVRHNLGLKTPSNVRTRTEEPIHPPKVPTTKEMDKDIKDKKHEKENGGWLSSIGKLIRPKNQMKLPDDKNPSIVWDKNKGQWVDKENAESEGNLNTIKPPPKASELRPLTANIQDQGATQLPYTSNVVNHVPSSYSASSIPSNNSASQNVLPPDGSNNIYKLPKGRGMKANYVNVLSQNTSLPASNIPPAQNLIMDSSSTTSGTPNVNYFIPSSG